MPRVRDHEPADRRDADLDEAFFLSRNRRYLLKHYGLALALASLTLFLRGVLPFPEGASIYQLPLAAVVLSAWYGGRGPGLVASLLCITGTWYWFVPPVNSITIAPEHRLPLSIFIALCLCLTEFSAGRRRGAQALRASEERFRALVQFSFDVYWESDPQHRFTRQEFSDRLTDAPAPGSEIGKTRWEVSYLEPDEESWRQHRATLDAHLPFRDFELARPTPEGGKRYVSVSGIPVFDEAGRFLGYRGVGRNITQSKRAEAEHRMHVWFLESMDRINRAMQGTNDLEQMMGDVLDAVLEIFASDRAWILYPCDPNAPSWRVVMERTRPEFPGAGARGCELPMTADYAEVARVALDSRGALPAGPRHGREVKPDLAERFGVRSAILMALRPKDDRPHLFGLHQCSHPRTWTKEEQRLFEEIGHRLADALTSLIAFRSLRESERRLEAAQRIAHVGWWERDFGERIAHVGWWERDFVISRIALSDEGCRIFGVQPLELPQWHGRWLSLIHPEDRSRAAAASAAALAGGARYDVEYRVVNPDGTVRMVHSQGDVIFDASGQPVRQFGVMQDITELRQAEQGLRARQEMLDLAQQAARAVAFDWHIGARESENRWSPELEAMYGLAPGTFDRTYPGWKKLVHPDDWQSVKLAIQRAHESGDVAAEYRVIHKDGSMHWLQAKGRMFFDAECRPERMIGFMIDVTDRRHAEEALRESEARFRKLTDLSADWYWRQDENLRFTHAADDKVGYSAPVSLGKTRWELPVTPLSASWDEHRAVLAARQPFRDFEYSRIDPDGGTRYISVSGVPVFDERGAFKGYDGMASDITARKRAEEALRTKDEALQLVRAELAHVSRMTTLGELTASIAHEVNQPLGAMVANAAACVRWLSAQPPDTANARRALESIVAGGRRAGEVIGRIRALVKRQAARKAVIDMNEAIAEVLALVQQELRSNDIMLATWLAGDLPPVLGDRVQLQQVLLNLIVNAIEAMGAVADRARELAIASSLDGPDAVVVEVRDSGPGLDAERAEQLFEAFYTTKAEGVGIGLSISRSIVEEHGGRLWAAPNAPHGAVFRFSLPAEGRATP